MNLVFLNNIVPNKSMKFPIDYAKQIEEILNYIDSKVKKENILKMTLYYTSRECYDEIQLICETWKPRSLEIEYVGNYMNYNPLIKVMGSIISQKLTNQNIHTNEVNYII